jgi:hypothetical protein
VARAAAEGQAQVDNMLMNDFGDTLRAVARERIKPKINEAKARQALGVSPDQAASSSPAKAK